MAPFRISGAVDVHLIFSGVFERHPRLALAIVEFELAWAPHLLSHEIPIRHPPDPWDLLAQATARGQSSIGIRPESQVRNRLPAGEKRIRTAGPASESKATLRLFGTCRGNQPARLAPRPRQSPCYLDPRR
jgi:hypothetical protein